MKKKNLFLTCAVAAGLMITGCSGDTNSPENDTQSSVEAKQMNQTPKFNYSSADDAIVAYTELMKEYANLLEQGDTDAAEKHLKNLESLEHYVNNTYSDQTELLKSMTDMSKGIMDLQSEYLDNAMDMYDDLLDGMGDTPGASEAKAALKEGQKEMDDAMKDAQKQMDDAMKAYGGGL